MFFIYILLHTITDVNFLKHEEVNKAENGINNRSLKVLGGGNLLIKFLTVLHFNSESNIILILQHNVFNVFSLQIFINKKYSPIYKKTRVHIMIYLIQNNFKNLTYYQNLLLSSGIKENQIISQIDSFGIEKQIENNNFSHVFINSSYYNFYTSTIFEKNKNIDVIITDVNENPKTIRLVYSSYLKFIDKNNAKYEIYSILTPLKKAV